MKRRITMKRKTNNMYYKTAYGNRDTYCRFGYATESGDWMAEDERTSYHDELYGAIFKDLNRKASSMRV